MKKALLNKGLLVFFVLLVSIFSVHAANCGDTITSDLTLSSDLKTVGNNNCPDDGITIDGAGITLDCAGYTIKAIDDGFDRKGINILSHSDDVIIKNCNIQNFPTGIHSVGSNNLTFINNYINASDLTGVYIVGGENFSLINNQFNDSMSGVQALSPLKNILFQNNSFFSGVNTGLILTGTQGSPISGVNFYNQTPTRVSFNYLNKFNISNMFGSIYFKNTINSLNSDDLENKIIVSSNNIYINTTALPIFITTPAKLTLINVGVIPNPFPYRNGVECPLSICSSIIDLGSNSYSFNVTGFSNFSVGVGLPPVVNLSMPLNRSIWNISHGVIFNFTVNDSASDVANCTLFILDQLFSNNQYVHNQSAISENLNNTILATLPNSKYKWYVNCTDTAGFVGMSQVYNLTVRVHYPPVITYANVSKLIAKSNEDIYLNITCEDNNYDDTQLTIKYRAYNYTSTGAKIIPSTYGTSLIPNNVSTLVMVIPKALTTRGDNWTIEVNCSDSKSTTIKHNTSNVTIINTPVNITDITPLNNEYHNKNVTVQYNVYDADGLTDIMYCQANKNNGTGIYNISNKTIFLTNTQRFNITVKTPFNHVEDMTWWINCTDTEGFTNTVPRALHLDNVNPIAQFGSPRADDSTLHDRSIELFPLKINVTNHNLNWTNLTIYNSLGVIMYNNYSGLIGGVKSFNYTNFVNITTWAPGVYSVNITAKDYANNIGNYSAKFRLVNNIPFITNNKLYITDSMNLTNGTLIANFTFNDIDGDPQVWNNTRWYTNGVLNSTFNDKIRIPASKTYKHQVWYYMINVSDGFNESLTLTSNSIEIKNALPWFNMTFENQSAAYPSLFSYDINCSDLDQDALVYSFVEDPDLPQISIDSSTGIISGWVYYYDTGIYNWTVGCSDGEVTRKQNITFTVNDIIPPEAPLLEAPLNDSIVRTTTPTLWWSAVTDAYRYKVEISSAPDFSSIVEVKYNLTTNAYQTKNLLNRNRYYWRVNDSDFFGNTNVSGVFEFFIDTIPLPNVTLVAPENGAVIFVNNSNLFLTANIENSNGFTVRFLGKKASEPTIDDVLNSSYIVGNKLLTFNWSDITDVNDTYYWKVFVNDSLVNYTSETRMFKVSYAPDVTPPNVTDVDLLLTDTTAKITWYYDEPANGIINYGTSRNNYTFSTGLFVPKRWNHTAILTGLTPNKKYYYKIFGTDASGNLGNSSELNFTTLIDSVAPSSPLLNYPLNNTFIKSKSVLLSWIDVNQDETSYTLVLDNDSTLLSPKINVNLGGDVTSYQVYNLTENKTYYWQVSVKDYYNNINVSEKWRFQVDTLAPVIVINNPSAGEVVNQTLNVTFTGAETSPIISVDGGAFVSTLRFDSHIIDTTALVNGVHTIKICDSDLANNSGCSELRSFTVHNELPHAPILQDLEVSYNNTYNKAKNGTRVTISVEVLYDNLNGTSLDKVLLYSSNLSNNPVYQLNDNGQNGDLSAGDYRYTVSLNVKSGIEGIARFRVMSNNSIGQSRNLSSFITVDNIAPNCTLIPIDTYVANGERAIIGIECDGANYSREAKTGVICGLDHTKNMISYWTFDSSAVDDYSSNEGAVYGASTVAGKLGSALYFDGIDDYVVINDSDSIDLDNDFTISFWIKRGRSGILERVLMKKPLLGADSETDYGLWFNTTNEILVDVADGSTLSRKGTGYFISDTSWHSVVYRYKDLVVGGNWSLFVDGVKVAVGTHSVNPSSNLGPLIIGKHVGAPGGISKYHFQGTIDEFTMFNRALTDDQTNLLYSYTNSGEEYCRLPESNPIINRYSVDSDFSLLDSEYAQGLESVLPVGRTAHAYTLNYFVSKYNTRSSAKHEVQIQVRDELGNGPQTMLINVTLDNWPARVDKVINTTTLNSASVWFNTTEKAEGLIVYGIKSGNYTYSTGWYPTLLKSRTITIEGLTQNTTYYYRIYTKDNLSIQYNSSEYIFTTLVDTVAPSSPLLLSPMNNTYIKTRSPVLSWQDVNQDEVAYELLIDDASNFATPVYDLSFGGDVTSYQAINLVEGQKYYWKVLVRDARYNWNSSKVFYFTVDTLAPVITITKPTPGKVVNGSLNVTFNGGEVLPVITIDGGAFNPTDELDSHIIDTTSLVNGVHTVKVCDTDVANNTGCSEVRSFTVHNENPHAPVLSDLLITYPHNINKVKNNDQAVVSVIVNYDNLNRTVLDDVLLLSTNLATSDVLVMHDDGLNGDVSANDLRYSVRVPISSLASYGGIKFNVTANNSVGMSSVLYANITVDNLAPNCVLSIINGSTIGNKGRVVASLVCDGFDLITPAYSWQLNPVRANFSQLDSNYVGGLENINYLGSGRWTISYTVSQANNKVDGLYPVSVYTLDEIGNGPNVTIMNIRLDNAPAIVDKVTNVTTMDSVNIWYNTSEVAEGLIMYGTSSNSYTYSTGWYPSLLKERTILINNLLSNTNYYYRIFTIDNAGNRWNSTEYIFKTQTDTVAPSMPILVYPLNNSYIKTFAPLVSWRDVNEDETAYTLLVDNDSTLLSPFVNLNLGGDVTDYQLSNLVNNKTYYWQVSVRDAFSNTNSSVVWQFTVDAVAPNLTFTYPSASQVLSGFVNITFIGAEISPMISIDGANYIPTTGFNYHEWNTTNLIDASHTLRIKDTDVANNTGYSNTLLVITNNRASLKPVISNVRVDYPTAYQKARNYTTVIISAVVNNDRINNSMLDRVILYSGNLTSSQKLAMFDDGTNGDLVARDNRYTKSFTLDSNLSTGRAYYVIFANNTFSQSTTVSGYVNVDNVKPKVTYLNYTDVDGIYRNGETINLRLVADAPHYLVTADFSKIDSFYVPGAEKVNDNGDNSYTITYTLSEYNIPPAGKDDGLYNIRLTLYDEIGNGPVYNNSLNLTLDNTPQNLVIINPLNNTIVANTINVRAIAPEDTKKVGFQIFNGSWMSFSKVINNVTYDLAAPWENSLDTTTFKDGNYLIRVSSYDNANHITSFYDTYVIISNNMPTVNSIKINNNAVYATSLGVILTLNATYADECRYSNVYNSAWSGWSAYGVSKVWNLLEGSDGLRTVFYQCRNSNSGALSQIVNDTIILDINAPTVNLVAPQGNLTIVRNLRQPINISLSDLISIDTSSVVIKVSNNGQISDVTLLSSINANNIYYAPSSDWLENEDHNIYVYVKDLAGNSVGSLVTPVWTFRVDTTNPIIYNVIPANNAKVTVNNPKVNFRIEAGENPIDLTSLFLSVESPFYNSTSMNVERKTVSFSPSQISCKYVQVQNLMPYTNCSLTLPELLLGRHNLSISIRDTAANSASSKTSFNYIDPRDTLSLQVNNIYTSGYQWQYKFKAILGLASGNALKLKLDNWADLYGLNYIAVKNNAKVDSIINVSNVYENMTSYINVTNHTAEFTLYMNVPLSTHKTTFASGFGVKTYDTLDPVAEIVLYKYINRTNTSFYNATTGNTTWRVLNKTITVKGQSGVTNNSLNTTVILTDESGLPYLNKTTLYVTRNGVIIPGRKVLVNNLTVAYVYNTPLLRNGSADGYYKLHIRASDLYHAGYEILPIMNNLTFIYNSVYPKGIKTLVNQSQTNSSVLLNWTGYNPLPDVSSYRIFASTSVFTNLQNLTPLGTTTLFHYNVTSLNYNTTYWFAVAAVDLAGNMNNTGFNIIRTRVK